MAGRRGSAAVGGRDDVCADRARGGARSGGVCRDRGGRNATRPGQGAADDIGWMADCGRGIGPGTCPVVDPGGHLSTTT